MGIAAFAGRDCFGRCSGKVPYFAPAAVIC